jgi:hypothetical protein
MAYSIIGHAKIKTASHMVSVEKHNTRKMFVPNSQYPDAVRRPLGSGSTISQLVDDRLKYTGVKVKKNSVLAYEIMLTASPEFYKTDDVNTSIMGKWDKKKTNDWYNSTKRFLVKKYGKNLVAVDVHLDENSPHIHAIVTPIQVKKRKLRGQNKYVEVNVLDAKTMFSPDELRKTHSQYIDSVKHLGLERGVKGSTLAHKPIKTHSNEVAKQLIQTEKELSTLKNEIAILMELIEKQTNEIERLKNNTEALKAFHTGHKLSSLEHSPLNTDEIAYDGLQGP